jgi:cell wall-associated NlpC family hydrolase
LNKIVEIATSEIGYAESPAGSNRTKYGRWFGLDGVPWCAIFVSWCYAQAGRPLGRIGYLKGFAGCQTGYDYWKKHNKLTSQPVEGDIVLFDWNRDGRFDHTGIFVKDLGNGYFQSIEGNTSLANQSNGGQVQLRKRSYATAVFVHPSV